jgi:hypothetical protein
VSPAPLTLIRAAWGAVLLAVPDLVLPAGERRGLRVVARVLGARHLAQAGVIAAHHTPGWRRAGAVVDALHAATALGAAVVWPSARGPALASAVTASVLATEGFRSATR